ncbi:hypothetical protein ACFSVJ_08370 [Prauserella oleivorans]
MAGPQLLGSITLAGRPGLGEQDRRLFERASVVTALLLLLRRSAAEAEDRVRGELLTDLLSAPGRDPAALLDRGRRLGLDLSAPHSVLALHADDVPRPGWPRPPPGGVCSPVSRPAGWYCWWPASRRGRRRGRWRAI